MVVDGSGGGGYLFVNRGYPPFEKGVGLGDVHIGGIFFCYSKLLLYKFKSCSYWQHIFFVIVNYYSFK